MPIDPNAPRTSDPALPVTDPAPQPPVALNSNLGVAGGVAPAAVASISANLGAKAAVSPAPVISPPPMAGPEARPVHPTNPTRRLAIRSYRDVVVSDLRAAFVGGAPNTLQSTFKSVSTSPRRITPAWIAHVSRGFPACFVAWSGVPRMDRLSAGQLVGPHHMCIHVLAEEWRANPAHDAVIDLAEIVSTHIERRVFGDSGPAVTTAIEYVWDEIVDNKGYALASVIFEQALPFGANLQAREAATDWGPDGALNGFEIGAYIGPGAQGVDDASPLTAVAQSPNTTDRSATIGVLDRLAADANPWPWALGP